MSAEGRTSATDRAWPHTAAALFAMLVAFALCPPTTFASSGSAPDQPTWITPGPIQATLSSPVTVRVQAGASTSVLALSVNGVIVRAADCVPGAVVDLGAARLEKGANTIMLTATGPTGETTTVARSITRIEWPYDTCIVIDKSDYRLYWVRGQQLVASYPIAHGRNNRTPVRTWRVLAKYKSDPHSIYGPRKMRLFKRVGHKGHYRYVSTRFLIHGTNEPKKIGTQASHGCIRMYNGDVRQLFPQVPRGTYVVTRR